jgi:darcynin-like uncharacterized protein
MNYTIVILFNATSQWLSMSRTERDHFNENELRPILRKYSDTCKISLFDSDFTHSSVSDFIIIETDDLIEYGYMMGYLRESKTLAAPYFEIKELVVGVPNNFRGSIDVKDIK